MPVLAEKIFRNFISQAASSGWVQFIIIILILLIYRKLRLNRWRGILKESIEYHRFHLGALSRDNSIDMKSRELAQSLLWAVSKQLPAEIKECKGTLALLNSLAGNKTSINTCGTVFYETAKNYSTIEPSVQKLNNTLISTLYRIFLLESPFSIISVLFYDLSLLVHFLKRTKSGSSKLYLDLNSDLRKNRK